MSFTIRPATDSDCRWMYDLSTAPDVRALSTRGTEYTYEDHCQWWSRRGPNDPLSQWWILEGLGYIRYCQILEGRPLWSGGPDASSEEAGKCEVSIVLDPAARGRGIGSMFLRATAPLVQNLWQPRQLVALILPHNGPSLRAFESAGYRYERDEERMGKMHERWVK